LKEERRNHRARSTGEKDHPRRREPPLLRRLTVEALSFVRVPASLSLPDSSYLARALARKVQREQEARSLKETEVFSSRKATKREKERFCVENEIDARERELWEFFLFIFQTFPLFLASPHSLSASLTTASVASHSCLAKSSSLA